MASLPDLCVFRLARTVERLEFLASKPDGWKEPGSVTMRQEAKEAALVFLSTYAAVGPLLKDIRVCLDADGEVTFFWKDAEVILDLSVGRDRKYSYYAQAQSGVSFDGDGLEPTVPLPSGLCGLLRIAGSA